MFRPWWVMPVVVLMATIPGRVMADDSDRMEVEKRVRQLNNAFKTNDRETVDRLMTDTHVAITVAAGMQTKKQQLATLSNNKLSEYREDDLKIVLAGKDVAVVTYRLTQKGTFQGREVSPKSYACAVWVRRDGKWKEATYQETPIQDR